MRKHVDKYEQARLARAEARLDLYGDPGFAAVAVGFRERCQEVLAENELTSDQCRELVTVAMDEFMRVRS